MRTAAAQTQQCEGGIDVRSAADSNIGVRRLVNQDRVYASDRPVGIFPNLYIVADGMGGEAAGEVAAAAAVESAVRFARSSWPGDPQDLFREMGIVVNADVYDIAVHHLEYAGMGTTFVAASVYEDAVYCINIGDSRLYAINYRDEFVRITTDHSLVEAMVQRGQITEEEARVHRDRNLITRAVGTNKSVQADIYRIPIGYPRMLLLCSDGLHGQVDDSRISEIMRINSYPLSVRVEMLIQEANRNGGSDNVSVILADLGKEVR